MPFTFVPRSLPGLVLIQPRVFADDRGTFAELYKRSDLERAGIAAEFVQGNTARSAKRGTLRGLHYQIGPAAQGKLVRCVRGEVLDVAVDLRKGSPTLGKWDAVVLSEENLHLFWIPPGFAHGYCANSEQTEVEYQCTAEYAPHAERSIRWDDPDLAIAWPTRAPVLSGKDAKAPSFREAERPFVWTG